MKLKRHENIHFAEVGDEYYVILEDKDALACLNTPAFVLMENCDGFTDPKEWAYEYARKTDLDEKYVFEAVDDVLDQMRDAGFLVHVETKTQDKRGPFNFDYYNALDGLPKVERMWDAKELAGGMFVNAKDGDIKVIVPNVTDGPIKTCPPHTCTIPAGLFTADTIIRTFNDDWRANFQEFRRDGLVHFNRRR